MASLPEYRERLYGRYISTHFGEHREISVDGLERQLPVLRRYFGHLLPKDKTANILDIGCGYGALLYFLRKEGYVNVWGVDLSPEQVAAARRLGFEHVHCADGLEFLKAKREFFQAVIASDLLEHLKKDEVVRLLEAAYEALTPGGTLVVQTANAESPFFGTIRYGDFTHELAFTRHSVAQLFSVAGFTGVRVYPAGPVVHGLFSAVRLVLWHGIKLLLCMYQAVETGCLTGHIFTRDLIAAARKPDDGPGAKP